MNSIEERFGALKDEDVLRLSLREPDVFELIVTRFQEAFLRKALSILGNHDDAEDAVSETFVRMYAAAGRFKEVEGASVSSWGYTILVRQCFTIYQKRKKRLRGRIEITEELEHLLRDTREEEGREEKLIWDEFLVSLSKLPLSLKNAVEDYFLKGRSHAEIAKSSGVKEGAVRVRIHRAKKILKEMNEEEVTK